MILGPIAGMFGDVMKIIGITAAKLEGGLCANNLPAYYTNLAYHLDWIILYASFNS